MHRGAVLRVFSTVFLIVTMLGSNQSFAQDIAPVATPVSENVETEPAESQTDNGVTPEDSATQSGTPESTAPSAGEIHSAARTSSPLDITLFTISGQVSNDSGTPLVGAQVCYEGKCSFTSEGGLYSLEDVGDGNGNGRITANMDFHFSDSAYLGNPGQNTTFNFVLEEIIFHTVSGQITDGDGTPLSNLTVCLGTVAIFPTTCTRTNTDGIYALPAVRVANIFSGDPAWMFDSGDAVLVDGDITVNLTATPREGAPAQTATLFGAVEDRSGNPINHFTVCYNAGGKGGHYCEISNGESNDFELVFRTGSVILYGLTIAAADCPTHDTGMFDELFSPGLHDLGTFILDCEQAVEQTYTISGQVTYRDGTPYSNGVVPFWHDSLSDGWTDDDGYYTITDVPNGNYQIGGAFAPGFGSDVYQVTVEDGNAVQNLIVAWSPTIGGEITDADGNPISAQVCFAQRCTTAENGLYQMVANSDEEIVVTVSHDGYVTQLKTVINDGPIASHDLNFVLQQSDDGDGQNGGDNGNGDNGDGQNGGANGNGDNGDGQDGDANGNGDNGDGQNSGANGNGDNGDSQNGGANGNENDDDGNGQNVGDNGDGSSDVTGLPETGTGTDSVNITLWLATAASVMMTAGAFLIRQKRA